jgi:hypothetical protein
VVLVTSRQGHFTATSSGSDRIAITLPRHPFSRSYGVILPSSLTRVLPFALVYSTRLPVSVCGTGTRDSLLRGFSWRLGSTHLRLYGPGTALRIKERIFLLPSSPYTDVHPNPITGLVYHAAFPHRSSQVGPEY